MAYNHEKYDTDNLVWRGWNAFASLEGHKRFFMREFTRRFDLSENEIKVILLLHWHKQLKQSSISKMLQIDAGNLSREIDRMEERGLVSRQACQEDARTYEISLGENGFKVIKSLDANLLSRLRNLYEGDEDSELYRLLIALEELDQNIQEERDLYTRYRRIKDR